MFRKILIIAMFATAAGYCFASENIPQIVTSEVVYQENKIPTWPVKGSDADVNVACGSAECDDAKDSDNIKIVSKIGTDLVVENNFNMNKRNNPAGWSGGANMLHGSQLPVGFDDEFNTKSEMPLLHREMLEDDGGHVLTVSRSSRKEIRENRWKDDFATEEKNSNEIAVDQSADAEAPKELQDQVRSWVVASGQTLRDVLQDWCNKEGWDFVWATSREYPIEASAVFKGRFVDVSSALVRNFGRATPIPYAKFYKGNRVLVVSTTEE